jgi:uncharacterized protein (DUF2267 family)
MKTDFESFTIEETAFLKKIAGDRKAPGDLDLAYQDTKSFFHVLRDVIPVEDSLALLSQLPEAIKEIYIEGWNQLKARTHILESADFFHAVKAKSPHFKDLADARSASYVLFSVLRQGLSQKVLHKIQEEIFREAS